MKSPNSLTRLNYKATVYIEIDEPSRERRTHLTVDSILKTNFSSRDRRCKAVRMMADVVDIRPRS